MKQVLRFLSCIALLVLLQVAFGEAKSSKDTHAHIARGLRGGHKVPKVTRSLVSNKPTPSLLQIHGSSQKLVHKASKRSRSLLHKLLLGAKRVVKMHKHSAQELKAQVDDGERKCVNKLRWWIMVKIKCVKAFGKESRWDREKMNGKCNKAWSQCNTGFYAVCCSQPQGPRNMKAYCENQALKKQSMPDSKDAGKEDKACEVNNMVKGVQGAISGIKNAIGLLNTAQTQYGGPSPGPAPMPESDMAPQIAPPAGLVPSTRIASPAPAPMPMPGQPVPSKCAMLTELTRQAAERIEAIKQWAAKDGIKESVEHQGIEKAKDVVSVVEDFNDESPQAKDPDLVFSVKGVLRAGEKLNAILKNGDFCNTVDDSSDDETTDLEEDLKKDPTQAWGSDEGDAEEDEEDDDDESTVNETVVKDLLDWDLDMQNAIDKFDKDVHPHGFKWWRYRFEYTEVESVVLAFSVMVLYLVMNLLHGISFFESSKFYKTGVPQRLHRYAWAYLVFHAAALMIMVSFAYALYIPWGDDNIFNQFAEFFQKLVDGRANVPFLGYSWLYMVLDVQFQLFMTFALYSLFVLFVVRNYATALHDWRALSEENWNEPTSQANVALYRSLEATMKKRIQMKRAQDLKNLENSMLTFPGVVDKPIGASGNGWNEFKLHLFLTEGLGKSVEYLVQVSLTTYIFLACSALVVALLAHHAEVAFMYFLPAFVIIGFAIFVAGYLVSRHFRALSDKEDHTTAAKYVTPHSFCRAIQIMLYCLFFSFSRLLLSNDIYEFYPRVYISAIIGLTAIMLLLKFFATDIIKETSCALILPPHLPPHKFQQTLQHISYWHVKSMCHECGVLQKNPCPSRSWAMLAGDKGAESMPPLDTERASFIG